MRRATPADAASLGPVFTAARLALGFFPALHTAAEDVAYFAAAVGRDEVFVTEVAGEIAGFCVATPTRLEHLYVHPDHQGRGMGSALFDAVAAARPSGFDLWVFEANERAIAFYEARGCVEVERTDGARNEERLADRRLMWSPSQVSEGRRAR